MSAIYLLTAGEYSDYHIVAAYSSRELAEEAQSHYPYSDIEEYEVDAMKVPEHPPGYTAWSTVIDADKTNILWTNEACGLSEHFKVKAELIRYEPSYGYSPKFIVNCWARDKEHAEKIALDKFYQWKWENQQWQNK